MNKVELLGRLTRDPQVSYLEGEEGYSRPVAKYTLAVERWGRYHGADFIPCTAFDKLATNAEKYLKQGNQIIVIGRIRTRSYTDKEGKRVYVTNAIVDEQYFLGYKTCQEEGGTEKAPSSSNHQNGVGKWAKIPDMEEEGLPFK